MEWAWRSSLLKKGKRQNEFSGKSNISARLLFSKLVNILGEICEGHNNIQDFQGKLFLRRRIWGGGGGGRQNPF